MRTAKSRMLLSLGLLTLSLTFLPATLTVAQTSPDAPTVDTTPFQESEDDANNWGWLGAFGLLGLLNLFRKPDRDNRVEEQSRTYPGSTHGENPVTRQDQP
jgi:hypothetical protein